MLCFVAGLLAWGFDDRERRVVPTSEGGITTVLEANRTTLGLLVRRLERIGKLSKDERHAVESLPVKVQTLGPRQDIVRDGDKPDHSCLIVEGWAYRYKLIGEGRRQILSFHVPGDMPDLHSLHIETMDHSLASLTEATIAFIPHDSILDATSRFPGLASILWRETLIDAAIFRQWITGMGQRDAFGRMAHLFCELYSKLETMGLAADHRCALPITQDEIGDALGLSSVHTNRVSKEMRRQGLIELRTRTLSIIDWDSLVQTAEFNPAYLRP